MSVVVNNPCREILPGRQESSGDPAQNMEATAVPARDESDDQHGRGISGNFDCMRENGVVAQQNIALAIIAQENKQRELWAGNSNRALNEKVDGLVSDKLHLRTLIEDVENRLANNNADLISRLQHYIDFLEKSAKEAAWRVTGLQDEIHQHKGSVNLEKITRLNTVLDWEKSHNNRLCMEKSGLDDVIYRLYAALNERQINTSSVESKLEEPQLRTCHLVRPVGRRRRRETIPVWKTMRHYSQAWTTIPIHCSAVWDWCLTSNIDKACNRSWKRRMKLWVLTLEGEESTPSHVSTHSSHKRLGSKGH
jgi:chromosome segregation ATPase